MKKVLRPLVTATLFALFALCLIFGAALLPRAGDAEALSTTVSVLPRSLSDLFTDYTRTALSAEHADGETLEKLRADHADDKAALDVLDRAEAVLHGAVRFDPAREFSTAEDAAQKIPQDGSMPSYSNDTLKWKYSSSDLLITGIYGVVGDVFTVYVEAENSSSSLPRLVLTRQHAKFGQDRETVYLHEGANTFTYGAIGTAGEAGGAIYLSNPYTQAQGEVSVYIEGGGSYPVFEKDGDETAFLGELERYESARRKGEKLPDLAELSTDFAFFTTTSSSLYDTYITYRTISPQENMTLWGNFFKQLYEFNGIPTDGDSPYGTYDPRVKGVRLNFRYMQQYQNSGAYATNHYIGIYRDHLYWLANYNNMSHPTGSNGTNEYALFSLGHEVGHMLDTDGRNLDETTNNMTAAFAYVGVMNMRTHAQWIPYAKSEALMRDTDVDHLAFDDGKILYTSGDYDHNYMMWWLLECRFPGYWAKLNARYRKDEGSALVKSYGEKSTERMVYLSSLVTGVDLGAYFERWGLYFTNKYNKFTVKGASETYRTLMEEAETRGLIQKSFDRFYYADDAEYAFIRAHSGEEKAFEGAVPAVSVKSVQGKRIVSLSGKRDPYHFGYEIRVSEDGGKNFTVAGFTRSSQFEDGYSYQQEPIYKAVAVNRFFAGSKESAPAQAGEAQTERGVCRVDNQRYDTLAEAISAVPQDGTVYLLGDCSLSGKDCVRRFTLAVDESVHENVHIFSSGSNFVFKTSAAVTLRGREDAHIVFDGGSVAVTYPPIYVGGGAFTAEYTDFAGCSSAMGGGSVYALLGDVTLRHCAFDNCTGKDADFISMVCKKTLTLEDCSFRGTGRDISLTGGATLLLSKDIPALKLSLGENATVCTDFEPNAEQLARLDGGSALKAAAEDGKIAFVSAKHRLTFLVEEEEYTCETDGAFVFGSEGIVLGERYIASYTDEETGKEYRAGERIVPETDMTFRCAVEENVRVALLLKSGTKEISVRADGRVYLPRLDGSDTIAVWTTRGGKRYTAGGSAPAAEGELIPLYENFFRYDFSVNGAYLKEGGFAAYGTVIDLPEAEGAGFSGWRRGEEILQGTAKITADVCFFAVFGTMYDLSDAVITFTENAVYSGKECTPAFTVSCGGVPLAAENYTFVYSDNVEAGEGMLVLTGVRLAFGQCSARFTIAPRPLTAEEVEVRFPADPVYTGEKQMLAPVLLVDGKPLGGESYRLSYPDGCVHAGTVEVSVLFCGNYTGGLTASYRILQAERPFSFPGESMPAGEAKTLGELSLPENWAWENGALPLGGEGTLLAKALYVGADASDFRVTETTVEILLAAQPDPEPQPEPDPDPEPDPEPEPVDGGKTVPPKTVLILAVCGGAAGVALAAILLFVLLKKRKH